MLVDILVESTNDKDGEILVELDATWVEAPNAVLLGCWTAELDQVKLCTDELDESRIVAVLLSCWIDGFDERSLRVCCTADDEIESLVLDLISQVEVEYTPEDDTGLTSTLLDIAAEDIEYTLLVLIPELGGAVYNTDDERGAKSTLLAPTPKDVE